MKTNQKILRTAAELLASDGFGAVSFDAIGNALGLSKQAVLYWYPSKQDLLAAMLVAWLDAEADTAAIAVANAKDANAAITAFVHAIGAFHLNDLDRFRMMYLAPQTQKSGAHENPDSIVLQQVHATTDRMYGALANCLDGDSANPRQQAVAIHSAVLGLVLMFGLADGIGDPLKHSQTDMLAALATRLTA